MSLFWEYSLIEVEDILSINAERYNEDEKVDVKRLFLLSELIAERVAYAFTSSDDRRNMQLTMPWDVLPELFESDEDDYTRQQEQIEFENYKAERRKRAMCINAQIAEVNSHEWE